MNEIELTLNRDELQELIDGLNMRICVIETGTYNLRAVDLHRMQSSLPKPRALKDDQIQLIARLLTLRDRLQNQLR